MDRHHKVITIIQARILRNDFGIIQEAERYWNVTTGTIDREVIKLLCACKQREREGFRMYADALYAAFDADELYVMLAGESHTKFSRHRKEWYCNQGYKALPIPLGFHTRAEAMGEELIYRLRHRLLHPDIVNNRIRATIAV